MTADHEDESHEDPVLLFVPRSASQQEAKVPNRDFMESLVDCGCWLRVIAANENRVKLADEKATDLERYSAIASFYQHTGTFVEDIITALVAWAVWAKQDSVYLADINERLVLSPGQNPGGTSKTYHQEVVKSFLDSTKRVRVNPHSYLASLTQLPDDEQLRFLGIPWKQNPSVKLVRRWDWDTWHNLPHSIASVTGLLDNSEMIVSCYNKLKHGPQIIISSIKECFARRGESVDFPTDKKYIRLLFCGAETQRGNDSQIAPFLLHDPYFVNAVFYQRIVPLAINYWSIASWLLYIHYKKVRSNVIDHALRKVFSDGVDWEEYLKSGVCFDKRPEIMTFAKIR
jgi:hypothetical protein